MNFLILCSVVFALIAGAVFLSALFRGLRLELSKTLAAQREELQHTMLQTSHHLEARVNEFSSGVQGKLDLQLKEGFVHFEKVASHLKQAGDQLAHVNQMGQSIHELNNLLKLPHLRGNFGEALLEGLLADLLPRDSYEFQYQISASSTERVDAVIKYPSALLPIDSKFPREQVLPLFENCSPDALEKARKLLFEKMKSLARQIREKYIRPEEGTTDMALLFVPSETLYFEVIRDPRLPEELAKQKVFAVSPNTLAITLHSINVSRRYYEMAKGVERTIDDVRKAQHHFLNFQRRFEEVGITLGRAQTAFQTAGTHLSRYESSVSRLLGGFEDSEVMPPPPSLVTEQVLK